MTDTKKTYLMLEVLADLVTMRNIVKSASLKNQSLADKLELQKLHTKLTDIQSSLRFLFYEYENAEILYYKPNPVDFWDN